MKLIITEPWTRILLQEAAVVANNRLGRSDSDSVWSRHELARSRSELATSSLRAHRQFVTSWSELLSQPHVLCAQLRDEVVSAANQFHAFTVCLTSSRIQRPSQRATARPQAGVNYTVNKRDVHGGFSDTPHPMRFSEVGESMTVQANERRAFQKKWGALLRQWWRYSILRVHCYAAIRDAGPVSRYLPFLKFFSKSRAFRLMPGCRAKNTRLQLLDAQS